VQRSEVTIIITEAIQSKKVVEVDYIREEDGARTCRMMEPFDIAVGRRSKNGEIKFWGWCRFHNRIEQKTIPNIISIQITDQHFDPQVRQRTFTSPPNYWIPRNW
jgi:predicted DNA-binding transcriptional regulator YafY